MKKSLLMKFLVLMLSVCSVLFVLTACGDKKGGKEEGSTCEHEWVIDEDKTVYATTKETGSFAYECDKCKQTKKETMEKLTYLNGVESLVTESYGVKVTDLFYNVTHGGVSAYSASFDVAELYLNVDSDGNITGEGQGVFHIISNNKGYYYKVKAYANNDGLYAYYEGPSNSKEFDLDKGSYIKMPYDALYFGAYKGLGADASLTLEDFLNMYQEIISLELSWIDEDIVSKLEDNALFAKTSAKANYNLNQAFRKILNKFFTVETENDLTIYTLDVEALKDFNDFLYETKLETAINKIFGKDTYSKLTQKIIGIFDISFGELVDRAQAYGMNPEEFIQSYDELLAECFEAMNNYLELSSPPVFLSSVNNMLSEFVGSEIDVYEILQDEEFLNTTIGEVVEFILQKQIEGMSEDAEIDFPTTLVELKADISAGLAYFKEFTVYDLLGINQEAKEDIDGLIEYAGSCISISFALDKDGVLKQFDLSVDYEGYDESYLIQEIGTISIINGLTVEANAEQIAENYEQLADSIEFEEGKVSYDARFNDVIQDYDDWQLNFVNGKLHSITIIEYLSYSGEYYHRCETTIEVDLDKSVNIFNYDCGDFVRLDITSLGAERIYSERYYNGSDLITESMRETVEYTIAVSYNTVTGEVVIDNQGGNGNHDWDYDTGICKNCYQQIIQIG